MGGPGSGRRQVGKPTTTSARELDVRVLRHNGLISRPDQTAVVSWLVSDVVVAAIDLRSTSFGVQLSYYWEEAGKRRVRVEQQVQVDMTLCNFGGCRFWFRCPVARCARRVAKLYFSRLGIFACRHCCGLVYESQRETEDLRAIRRADRVRKRLGWKPGILNGHGKIPGRMHGSTFHRLIVEHERQVQAALTGHARWAARFQQDSL